VTRALVVHHDTSIVEREAALLREAGYVVDTCHGPATSPCPVLESRPCPRAERADVLVYGLDLLPDRRSSVPADRHRRRWIVEPDARRISRDHDHFGGVCPQGENRQEEQDCRTSSGHGGLPSARGAHRRRG